MLDWLLPDKIVTQAYRNSAAGKVNDAVNALEKAIVQSDDPQGRRSEALGHICYQHGRYPQAAAAFEAALKHQPHNVIRLNFLASSLARSGQWEKANTLLDLAATHMPADLAPPAIRALIAFETPDYPAARKSFEQARAIFTRHPSQSHDSMGLLHEAAELMQQIPPDPPPAA